METQNIEYKETLASGKIKEDITMFANSDGGEIWVGYKDDGSVAKKFIYNQASLDQFINEVKIKISPPITSITIEYPTRENLSVGLILKVGKSYCDHHRYNEQLWVRSGTTRIRASVEEFKLREMKQSKKDYTGIAVSPKGRKSTLEDLDPKALEFLKEKLSGKNPEYRDKEIKHILVAEDLMDGDSPNFTACLFLGKYDKRHEILPREVSSIHYLYEDEKNKTEERFELELPWILNLPKLFTEINKRNFTLQDIDLFRPTEKQYSEKAVEEAVINAIAHRNWLISSWIEIIHTPTKLQIFNPGIFKPKLSDILSQDKNYDYLNPTLCAFLKTVNLMEREKGEVLRKRYI